MVECPSCGNLAPPVERCLHCNFDFRSAGLDRSDDFSGPHVPISGQHAVPDSDQSAKGADLGEDVERDVSGDPLGVLDSYDDDEDQDDSVAPTEKPLDEKKIWEEVFADEDREPTFLERHGRLIWMAAVVVIVGGAIIAALVVMTPTLEESEGPEPPLGDIPGYEFIGD